jgi:predicted transcriptional regulator YheO
MKHILAQFVPVADAIAKLLHPFAETVIHDLSKDMIVHIANPFSGRKEGDLSMLDLSPEELNGVHNIIGPYEKAGEKGQRIRSITAVLKDTDNRSIGLLCINLDFSTIEPALELLDGLLRPSKTESPPEILFRSDWRDLVKIEIRSFLLERNLTIDNLNSESRKELIKRLQEKRLFYARKSVEQIAGILKISRSTAYKYLNSIHNSTRSAKKKNKRRR